MPDYRNLFNDFVRLEIELWNDCEGRLLNEFDIPFSYYEIMSVIDQVTSCRVHDIATTLAITTGGASKLIDRIEAAGLCRRRPNPDDRRSSLLELTTTGRELLGAASVAVEEELDRRFGELPDRTLQQFATTLRRLRATRRREEGGSDRSA